MQKQPDEGIDEAEIVGVVREINTLRGQVAGLLADAETKKNRIRELLAQLRTTSDRGALTGLYGPVAGAGRKVTDAILAILEHHPDHNFTVGQLLDKLQKDGWEKTKQNRRTLSVTLARLLGRGRVQKAPKGEGYYARATAPAADAPVTRNKRRARSPVGKTTGPRQRRRHIGRGA